MDTKCLGVSLIALAGNVFAQSSGVNDPTSNIRIEEVVITASKKEESVLTSPAAVTAVTNEEIKVSGVVGLQDLNTIAPGLQVRNTGSFGAITFSIRGVSNADIFELANSPVATYMDGVYIGRPDAMGGIVYDIEQIEVLRGPQGTLYGRNSTGGNVNIITAKPVQDLEGSFDFSLGNYNEAQARGVVNTPISDTLAIRGSFALRRNDGFFDTQNSTTENYGAANEFSVRLSTLWQPSETFDWHLILENYESSGTPSLDIVTGPDGNPADGLPVYDRQVPNLEEPSLEIESFMLRSRMDWSITDYVTLSYIAGYQDVELRPQSMIGQFTLYRDTPTEATSHELNISYDADRLQNIFGASYFHQTYGGFANAGLPNLDLLFFTNAEIETTAWGIFNQSTYNLTDSLRLIAGVRYTSEEVEVTDAFQTFCSLSDYPSREFPLRTLLFTQRELAQNDPGCSSNPGVFGGNFAGGSDSSKTTWKIGLAYDISDSSSAYATVSTGFKSGGINLGGGLTEEVATFAPENVTSYELGFKTRAFDNRLSLNTALYFVDYTDIQVTQLQTLPGGGLVNVTTNAAGAENYGLEIEGSWSLTYQSTLSGFINYTHATYTDYTNAIEEQSNAIIPSLEDNFLPYAPEYSVQVQYEYVFELANGGTLTPKATIFWQSESFIRPFNLPIDSISSFSKTDLLLTYTDAKDQWSVQAYVHNLEDETVRNGGFVFVGDYMSSYNAPRTYGARVTYRY